MLKTIPIPPVTGGKYQDQEDFRKDLRLFFDTTLFLIGRQFDKRSEEPKPEEVDELLKFKEFFNADFALLKYKNGKYNSAVFRPNMTFVKLGREVTSDELAELAITQRLSEKLARLSTATELRKNDCVDLMNYAILYCLSRDWCDVQEVPTGSVFPFEFATADMSQLCFFLGDLLLKIRDEETLHLRDMLGFIVLLARICVIQDWLNLDDLQD